MTVDPRHLTFLILRSIDRGAFADAALDKALNQKSLIEVDRRLLTELVYGIVRRQRTLDRLIDQLATKPAHQQPPDLRLLLHLGLYQLRYLTQIPVSAAVNTTVEVVKQVGFPGLAGFVNGLLRQYVRLSEAGSDPLVLPEDPLARLGIQYSLPDWIVQVWADQLSLSETELLCEGMNHPPQIDLRINPLRTTLEQVETAMAAAGVQVRRLADLPQALRLVGHSGSIPQLPGFQEGWWMVQDGSAQLVGHLLDPQPGEVIIDGCAAPGGKTMHLAELMGDRGTIWACDRTASRLRKLRQNANRLGFTAIQTYVSDSRYLSQFVNQADRVLLDVPCSGLGTLHRHADARWRQTPETVTELAQLQAELLQQAAAWVKPGGHLVYATCTLHPAENENQIEKFLSHQPDWTLQAPPAHSAAARFTTAEGWIKVWPQQAQMDGFFMARLVKKT